MNIVNYNWTKIKRCTLFEANGVFGKFFISRLAAEVKSPVHPIISRRVRGKLKFAFASEP